MTTAAPAATATARVGTVAGAVWAGGSGHVLHARLCAGVVAASSVVHVWLALQNQHGVWLAALMVAMAAVCLPCAVHIWHHNREGALHRVMVCALLMVALHGMLLVAGPSGGHVHLGSYGEQAPAVGQAGHLLAVIGLELTTALLAATLLARLRSQRQRTSLANGGGFWMV
jgi:hypothetical protein